jgi:hypothetical protein
MASRNSSSIDLAAPQDWPFYGFLALCAGKLTNVFGRLAKIVFNNSEW